MFLSSADFFLKINFLENFFKEYHQSVYRFVSRSGKRDDQGPDCLQRLSADGSILVNHFRIYKLNFYKFRFLK